MIEQLRQKISKNSELNTINRQNLICIYEIPSQKHQNVHSFQMLPENIQDKLHKQGHNTNFNLKELKSYSVGSPVTMESK